jgi:hypothetical protein
VSSEPLRSRCAAASSRSASASFDSIGVTRLPSGSTRYREPAGAELIVVSAANRWESALSRGLGDVDGSLSNRSTIDSAAFSRAPSLMSSCHRLPAL